jgi:hypothetical protein
MMNVVMVLDRNALTAIPAQAFRRKTHIFNRERYRSVAIINIIITVWHHHVAW